MEASKVDPSVIGVLSLLFNLLIRGRLLFVVFAIDIVVVVVGLIAFRHALSLSCSVGWFIHLSHVSVRGVFLLRICELMARFACRLREVSWDKLIIAFLPLVIAAN